MRLFSISFRPCPIEKREEADQSFGNAVMTPLLFDKWHSTKDPIRVTEKQPSRFLVASYLIGLPLSAFQEKRSGSRLRLPPRQFVASIRLSDCDRAR